MLAGFNLLWRPALGMHTHGATQILPRLILGAILITTAHPRQISNTRPRRC
jgi:hypothetical protein